MIRTIILPSSLDGIVTGCILSVGRIVGGSLRRCCSRRAREKLLAGGLLSTYFNSGATLSVGLYVCLWRGKYDVSYAIAAVLLVLVLVINLCAKLAKEKR